MSLQRRRLQTLLRDRFHLTIHRETRELTVYELHVAKGGPKLVAATCMQRVTGDTAMAPGKTAADYCGGSSVGRGRIQGPGISMAFLADILSGRISRTVVVDKTGLAGDFQILLTYTPDAPATAPDGAGIRPADGVAASDPGPDLFAALQQQLGLKLELAKGPVEVLVIDRVEKPTEN